MLSMSASHRLGSSMLSQSRLAQSRLAAPGLGKSVLGRSALGRSNISTVGSLLQTCTPYFRHFPLHLRFLIVIVSIVAPFFAMKAEFGPTS